MLQLTTSMGRPKTRRARDQPGLHGAAPPIAPPDDHEAEAFVPPGTDSERKLVPIPPHELPDYDTRDGSPLRDAVPPPPGYRYRPDGTLTPLCEKAVSLTDEQAQLAFCEVVQRTGSVRAACDCLGISYREIQSYLASQRDPIFEERLETAAERHRQAIYDAAYKRAVHGWDVPIVGGREKDTVVAYERRYSDTMTKMLLQRHFAEFRSEKSAFVKIDARQQTQNVQVDFSKMSRADRDAMRSIVRKQLESPPPADTDAVIDVPTEDLPQGD